MQGAGESGDEVAVCWPLPYHPGPRSATVRVLWGFFLEVGPHPSPPRPITPINQPKVGTSHLIFRPRIHGRYGSFLTMMVPS